jgi:ParB/RepB/Spo0J family partition protein
MSIAEQLALAPDAPVKASNRKVPLRRINIESGWPIDHDLVRSIGELGVLEPVILEIAGDGDDAYRYDIIDGRRRTAAAQAAGLKSIPARVVEIDGWLGREVIGILLNEQRGPNPVSELQAIEAMMAAGKSERDISRATGMDAATIRKRLKLTRLIAPLREALDRGDVKASLAESIAVLPEALQGQLADLLAETKRPGGLTHADVAAVRKVRHEQAAEVLGDVIAQTPASTERNESWEAQVTRLLEQAVQLIPDNQAWAWEPLAQVFDQLKRTWRPE